MPREVREEFFRRLRAQLGARRARSQRVLEEIEDHLIAQHDEWVELGWDPDQAWQKVIDEFGSVETFVNSESRIDQQMRWRWMMRYTTLTVMGTFGLLVAVIAFAPEQGRLKPSPAIAQEDPFATSDGSTADSSTPSGSADANSTFLSSSDDDAINAQMREKLDQRINITVAQTPLDVFLEMIAEEYEIEFYMDPDYGS